MSERQGQATGPDDARAVGQSNPNEAGGDGQSAVDESTTAARSRVDAEADLREAEVTLDGADVEAMGIEDLLALFRDAGIQAFEELECQGDGAIVRLVVDSPVDASAIDALDPVDRWRYATGSDSDHEYVVEFTAPRLPDAIASEFAGLVGTCDPELTDDGVRMSLVGAQETISNAIGEYRAAGARPSLRRLAAYHGEDDPLDALTERQREVLRTAWRAGHYEVPSQANTEDVAAELDLDPSTVAEHLQRAERNLLGSHLE